jgi:hypothetical protein
MLHFSLSSHTDIDCFGYREKIQRIVSRAKGKGVFGRVAAGKQDTKASSFLIAYLYSISWVLLAYVMGSSGSVFIGGEDQVQQ